MDKEAKTKWGRNPDFNNPEGAPVEPEDETGEDEEETGEGEGETGEDGEGETGEDTGTGDE